MRIFIKHDRAGEILSVCRTGFVPPNLASPFGEVGPGEGVLEVTGIQGLAELRLEDLHDSYKVSVDTGKVIEKG